MPGQDELLSVVRVWRFPDGTELPEERGDPRKGWSVGGLNIGGREAVLVEKQLYIDGEIYEAVQSPDGTWQEPKYLRTEKDVAARYKALTASPAPKDDPYGNPYIWDPNQTDPKTGRQGTFVPAPGMPVKPPEAQSEDWYTPNTAAPFLLRKRADGTLEQTPNPNYVPPTGRTLLPGEQESIDLKNQQLRMELEGRDPMSLYRQQTVAQNQAELEYKKQQDALAMQQRQSEADLARQQAAWRTASDMIEQQMKMAPTAARPGQEYWQGWGPGEAWSVLRPKLGLPYDPEKFKAPMLQFDPEEAWRRAMGMYGGQR